MVGNQAIRNDHKKGHLRLLNSICISLDSIKPNVLSPWDLSETGVWKINLKKNMHTQISGVKEFVTLSNVYFDQHLGAGNPKPWWKYAFLNVCNGKKLLILKYSIVNCSWVFNEAWVLWKVARGWHITRMWSNSKLLPTYERTNSYFAPKITPLKFYCF